VGAVTGVSAGGGGDNRTQLEVRVQGAVVVEKMDGAVDGLGSGAGKRILTYRLSRSASSSDPALVPAYTRDETSDIAGVCRRRPFRLRLSSRSPLV
jgi:hypothetical protein